MIATLTQIGDDLALILKPELLEKLGIDRESRLEITSDESGLHIRPVDDHRTRVLEAGRRVMEVHQETLRKLAQ